MNVTTTLEELTDEDIANAFVSNVSPYSLIKILNELTNRNLPTQMAYNYAKKNMLKTSTNELGKKFVTKEDAIEFVVKYVNSNVRKVEKEESK